MLSYFEDIYIFEYFFIFELIEVYPNFQNILFSYYCCQNKSLATKPSQTYIFWEEFPSKSQFSCLRTYFCF